MAWRFTGDFAGVGVGEDQPGIGGQDVRRKIRGDGEEQRIAVLAILRPFLVGAEVGNARLDFNNPNLSVAADGQNVGAPAVAERHLAQAFEVQRSQQALCAAQDGARALQLLTGSGGNSCGTICCGGRSLGHGAAIMAVRKSLASGRRGGFIAIDKSLPA